MNEVTIEKEFRFEASHVLPKHPGKCARLHGHSWVLRVAVKGLIDPDSGFVLDYAELKKLVNEHVVNKLDHTHLGNGYARLDKFDGDFGTNAQCAFGEGFYPSSENLVVAIGKILTPLIPELKNNVRLYSITLDETCTSRATWYA